VDQGGEIVLSVPRNADDDVGWPERTSLSPTGVAQKLTSWKIPADNFRRSSIPFWIASDSVTSRVSTMRGWFFNSLL
jgi:hypothetical protein